MPPKFSDNMESFRPMPKLTPAPAFYRAQVCRDRIEKKSDETYTQKLIRRRRHLRRARAVGQQNDGEFKAPLPFEETIEKVSSDTLCKSHGKADGNGMPRVSQGMLQGMLDVSENLGAVGHQNEVEFKSLRIEETFVKQLMQVSPNSQGRAEENGMLGVGQSILEAMFAANDKMMSAGQEKESELDALFRKAMSDVEKNKNDKSKLLEKQILMVALLNKRADIKMHKSAGVHLIPQVCPYIMALQAKMKDKCDPKLAAKLTDLGNKINHLAKSNMAICERLENCTEAMKYTMDKAAVAILSNPMSTLPVDILDLLPNLNFDFEPASPSADQEQDGDDFAIDPEVFFQA